jgi:hypothetical protein
VQIERFFISRTAVSSFMALDTCQQRVIAVIRLSALPHPWCLFEVRIKHALHVSSQALPYHWGPLKIGFPKLYI